MTNVDLAVGDRSNYYIINQPETLECTVRPGAFTCRFSRLPMDTVSQFKNDLNMPFFMNNDKMILKIPGDSICEVEYEADGERNHLRCYEKTTSIMERILDEVTR